MGGNQWQRWLRQRQHGHKSHDAGDVPPALFASRTSISPRPFTVSIPRFSRRTSGSWSRIACAAVSDMLTREGSLRDSIRDATFTVSPYRQYFGLSFPTAHGGTQR